MIRTFSLWHLSHSVRVGGMILATGRLARVQLALSKVGGIGMYCIWFGSYTKARFDLQAPVQYSTYVCTIIDDAKMRRLAETETI